MPTPNADHSVPLHAGPYGHDFTVVASDPWNEVPPRPPRRPENQNNPWGPKPGGNGGPPDFDAMVERLKKSVEDVFSRGGGGGGGGGPRFPGGGGGGAGRIFGALGPKGSLLVGAAVAAVWLASGFYRVQPDEQGIVMRFGAYERSSTSGLNYHLPWPVETVQRPAVTRINRVDIGYRAESVDPRGRGGDVSEESLMLTGDENIIDINAAVPS
jgi:modulator of FtsH protease HflK